MPCRVCLHPNYAQIHDLLKRGEAMLAIERRFGIDRRLVNRHRTAKPSHDPPKERPEDAKPEPTKTKRPREQDDREPLPTTEEIVAAADRRDRREILAVLIDRGKWRNLESARRLRRLWPDMSVERIAALAREASDDVRMLRGSRPFRREVMIAASWEVFRKAMGYGQLAAALNALRFVAELDGLVYEPGLVDSLLETQAWKIVEPLLRRESPRLWEKMVAIVELADGVRRQAEETLRNPEPLLVEARTEESKDEPEETFAATRNGGRRPRVERKQEDEGSAEG